MAKSLSSDQKLEIREEIERSLKSLPADTYKLIEEMVRKRVEEREKMYRSIAFVIVFAVGFVAASFFKITADNAVEKVTALLEKSETSKTIEAINKLHSVAQDKVAQLTASATEMTGRASELTKRVKELESQDNIVRYTSIGTLRFKTEDGAIWIEDRNHPGRAAYLQINPDKAEDNIHLNGGPFLSGIDRRN